MRDLVPLSETLIELSLPAWRALTDRLAEHIVIDEQGRTGIPVDVERDLLRRRRRELTLTVISALLKSISAGMAPSASDKPEIAEISVLFPGLPPIKASEICYGGYLPRSEDPQS